MDFNFNEITLENMGDWPVAIKTSILVISAIAVLFFGYWFDNSGQIDELHTAQHNEISLLDSLKIKQQLAANFELYKQQLDQINKLFSDMLHRLPTKSEVPGLLEDISKTGVVNGLEFKLFKPLPEVQSTFYAELPIEITVVGNYHQIAEFISEVASLDRIVTLHNFTINPVKPETNQQTKDGKQDQQNSGLLELNLTAKTYRYTGDQNKIKDDQKRIPVANSNGIKS